MTQFKTLEQMAEELKKTIDKSPWDFLTPRPTPEAMAEHDCHAGEEDGCKGCARLNNII